MIAADRLVAGEAFEHLSRLRPCGLHPYLGQEEDLQGELDQ